MPDSSKNPLISIVGTTATGKTNLALELASAILSTSAHAAIPLFSGVSLISADSRQVYRELEILSGADIPANFTHQKATSYDAFSSFISRDGKIELHGTGIISVSDEWSAGLFQSWVLPILLNAFENQKLPIVIGGTGLYHRMLTEEDTQLTVPPDETLRSWAQDQSVEELQKRLSGITASRLESMNESDRKNPRRLIRAIEIAGAGLENSASPDFKRNFSQKISEAEHAWYGVTASQGVLRERISKRVEQRLEAGVLSEVEALMKNNNLEDSQASTTLGLRECVAYISGEISSEQLRQDWITKELQYAKRQKTWWKQHDKITWFDTTDGSWLANAVKHIHSELSL